jgi:hypothetical protein
LLSWVFPLRSFLLPRLGSSTRPDLKGPNSLLRPKTQVRDSKDRVPLSRVRPSKARVLKKTSSTDSSSLKEPARTASRRRLPLSWPWTPSKLGALTFRASKYVESGVFSEETRLLP